MTSRFALSLALASTVLVQPAAAAEPTVEALSTCGQVMERKHATLEGDLDCSAQMINEPTVTLRPGGVLDLRGFTLTSRTMTTVNVPTVECRGKCVILGPGTVVGSGLAGSGGLVVSFEPFESSGRAVIIDATISGGQVGVAARRVELNGATVTGAREYGVIANKVDVRSSDVSGNGTAAEWSQAGAGISAAALVKVDQSTVTGNGMVGISAKRVKLSGTMLVGSDVSGNDAHADCASEICADVSAAGRPKVDEFSTCGRSVRDGDLDAAGGIGSPLPITEDWDVCTLD